MVQTLLTFPHVEIEGDGHSLNFEGVLLPNLLMTTSQLRFLQRHMRGLD
jgi:hypothetical protein